jgi:hypothetical protein
MHGDAATLASLGTNLERRAVAEHCSAAPHHTEPILDSCHNSLQVARASGAAWLSSCGQNAPSWDSKVQVWRNVAYPYPVGINTPGASVAVDQLMALVPLDLGFSNVTWEGAAIASPIALIMHVVPSAVLLASIMITVDALELHSLARLAQSSNPAT